MATLTYEEFLHKYILSVGNEEIQKIISEVDQSESEIFAQIIESIGKEFYQEYLRGKLDFIEDEDKPDNNNN